MPCRRAFTLIELLVVIAIIALLVSILLPAIAGARKAGRKVVCMSNMHQLAVAHHGYALDSKMFIASFTGTQSRWRSIDGFDQQALAVLQRYYPSHNFGQFDHGSAVMLNMVCEQFSTFVLAEYMGNTLPIPAVVCPEDQARLTWRKTPLNMQASGLEPQKGKGNLGWWPFSSSYQLLPTGWAYDGPFRNLHSAFTVFERVGQASVHDRYIVRVMSKFEVGGLPPNRKLEEVRYPANKVAVADSQQRHSGRQDLYFTYADARQPLIFWDGSVSERKTGDARPAWNPSNITATLQLQFQYVPDLTYESPVPQRGSGSNLVNGYYKWTRGGLAGVDYGGKEISTKGW